MTKSAIKQAKTDYKLEGKPKRLIGYIRISTDKQDLTKQEHLLFDWAFKNQLSFSEIIKAEISSSKTLKDRKIEEVTEKLEAGDWLVVAEISRLGRNMLQTLGIINTLTDKGVKIVFVRQPELSTNSPQAPLLLAVYSYFAQAEREYISIRTKQGLKALTDKGVKLGRPKGSRNKKDSVLEPYKEQILEYKKMNLPLASILKIIHNQMEYKVSYNGLKRFVLKLEIHFDKK